MPLDIPAAKFLPTGPSTTTTPPVMYSQQWSPAPSITATAPEFRTAKRSPAPPAANRRPDVAPYNAGFPISTPVAYPAPSSDHAAARLRWNRGWRQQRRQIQQARARRLGPFDAPQQFDPADQIVHPAHTERRHDAARLFGDEREVGDDLLGCAAELGAEVGALRGDAGRARIQVALARHRAA